MKTAILMFAMLMAACAVDLSTPNEGVGSAEQTSVLKPPAPQPEFQFCSGLVTCNPFRDGTPDFNCTIDCAEPAFCPDYTDSDFIRCMNLPNSTSCCGAFPCGDKRCIKGDRP